MPNHHDRFVVQARYATNDRLIVTKMTIAVELIKFSKNSWDIIQAVWTLRMTSNFNNVPRAQISVNFLGKLGAFATQCLDFFRNIDPVTGAYQLQLLDLSLELSDRLFEIQIIRVH